MYSGVCVVYSGVCVVYSVVCVVYMVAYVIVCTIVCTGMRIVMCMMVCVWCCLYIYQHTVVSTQTHVALHAQITEDMFVVSALPTSSLRGTGATGPLGSNRVSDRSGLLQLQGLQDQGALFMYA